MSHTKQQTAQLREPVFAHTSSKGCRLPGWEDVSVRALAAKMGRSAQHIREVLTGRGNCTVTVLEDVAYHLGLSLAGLVERIRVAKELDAIRLRDKRAIELLRQAQKKKKAGSRGLVFAGPRGNKGVPVR